MSVGKPMAHPADIFFAKMKGFYAGAGVKVIDPRFEDPLTPALIRAAYREGFDEGVKARVRFTKKVSRETGYKPSPLRAC